MTLDPLDYWIQKKNLYLVLFQYLLVFCVLKKLKKIQCRHSAEEMTLDPLDYWIHKKNLYLVLFQYLLVFCVLLPQLLQWNVLSQQAKLQGEREIASLMTT